MVQRQRMAEPTVSLLSSLLYVLHGARFLWVQRSLWKYAAAPTAISTILVGGAYVLLYKLSGNISRVVDTSTWYGEILYYAAVVLIAVIVTLVFVFLFTRIASALAAPFNELISQRTEQLVTGTGDEEPFSVIVLLKDSVRSLHHSLKLLGIYLALIVGGLPLLLLPGLGHLLYTVGGILLSAYMFSYEYLGYPMDRRRFSWEEKKGFLRSRLRAVIGFGLGSVAMASIPVVNLLFIPVAVVGATLLFLDLVPRDKS